MKQIFQPNEIDHDHMKIDSCLVITKLSCKRDMLHGTKNVVASWTTIKHTSSRNDATGTHAQHNNRLQLKTHPCPTWQSITNKNASKWQHKIHHSTVTERRPGAAQWSPKSKNATKPQKRHLCCGVGSPSMFLTSVSKCNDTN